MRPEYMGQQGEEIKVENASIRKSQGLRGKGKNSWPYKQPEIPTSPNHAMEFLCRSWSPSASDFLQIFSPNNFLLHNNTNEHDEVNSEGAEATYTTTIKQDGFKIDFTHTKPWLQGKTFNSIFRSRKEKKKEETRLHTAQLHAALSLTQLTAAIAGMGSSIGKQGVWNQDISHAISSSAALITTVWAEAAESLGAQRAQVRAAVNSGMAIQTPMDMTAVTATAATCLRGAAFLKSRATMDSLAKVQEMLKKGAEISIIMPSGRQVYTRVSIYLKNDHLMFSFRKKYFGGALKSTKEYIVTNITEERMECRGNSLLCLKTENGIIKLLFENEMQSKFWTSTIFSLLEKQSPCYLAGQMYNHFPSHDSIEIYQKN